ncbi:MAG: formate dehydrogenase subunit gamma [Acidobacteria bacterium]|nr:formate dehydrogenase subunit gamma [Acidobacteriota bacterium]
MRLDEPKVDRFNVVERVTHWLVALSFLYTTLTGLALWSPRLYWLAAVFGGGPTVRGWHPWGGVAFAAFFAFMFRAWNRQMRLEQDDRRWLRLAHRYAVHNEEGLPEAGRFNAGQKSLFWIQAAGAVVLISTGVVLWWPETMPRALRLTAILLHPVAAVVAIGGLIVHIYMGTAAVPEAFRGMIQGWVRPGWAASHHPKWYREVTRR